MKHIPLFLLPFLLVACSSKRCASINYCSATKRTFLETETAWKVDYKKEMEVSALCAGAEPYELYLEPELGVQAIFFNPKQDAATEVEAHDHIGVDLYTKRVSHVVASSRDSLESKAQSFTYKLEGPTFSEVEVSCYKK